MTDLLDEVTEIIVKHSSLRTDAALGANAVTPETRLADINIESLDLVEIVFEIEEHFKIEVPYNANKPNSGPHLEFTTVGEVVEGVRSILAKAPAL